MKAIAAGAVALVTLVLIDRALFNGKYSIASRTVLVKSASAFLR